LNRLDSLSVAANATLITTVARFANLIE